MTGSSEHWVLMNSEFQLKALLTCASIRPWLSLMVIHFGLPSKPPAV